MDFNELKNKVLAALGQATDNAKDIAGKAADSAKDIAEKAADKAKVGSRIAKLSMEVATERENMKKSYLEIGKLYYDTHKDNPDGLFIQLCEEVSTAEKAVAEKEAEIAQLKESFAGSESQPDIEVEFEEVVEKAEAEASEAVSTAADAVEAVKNEVAEAAADAVEALKDKASEVVEAEADVAETVKNETAEAAEAVETAVEDVVETVEEKTEE